MQDNCCGTGILVALISRFGVIITLTLPGTFRQGTGGCHLYTSTIIVTLIGTLCRTICPKPASKKVTPCGASTPLGIATSNSYCMGLVRHGKYENQCYESQKETTSECTHFLLFKNNKKNTDVNYHDLRAFQ